MTKRIIENLLLIITLGSSAAAQQPTYTVTKAAFSSDKYDEYSPVFYKNGIVFTSNRGSGSLVDYSGSTGKSTFDIKYIDTTEKVTWRKAKLFSKHLTTPFNEGPVTFSRSGDTIYFSRNIHVDGSFGELSNPGNKLGIFSAVWDGGKWSRISEFRYNNEFYNVTTPCLSPDGARIYFSSDRPGGYGGSDLYYCQNRNGFWNEPVNLGPVINTKGNESYPFMSESGELFFSSDFHPGLGGKDIFVTKRKDGSWYEPVRLQSPVNSEFDDFGFITDPLVKYGFFSSDRNKSVDIYSFSSTFFQFLISDVQKENQYCFNIQDTGSIQIDTSILEYIWDFGDESRINGKTAGHCFPGPGKYTINLDLYDRNSGKLFFRKSSFELQIFNIEQPFIDCQNVAVTGENVRMDGSKSYHPGYKVEGYFWDFGDGNIATGESVSHTYHNDGKFNISLGLILRSESTGRIIRRSVTKEIIVFREEREKTIYQKGDLFSRQGFSPIEDIKNIRVNTSFSAESDMSREAMYQLVVLSSKARTPLNGSAFRRVPSKYTVKEYFSPETGYYNYVIDKQMDLMDCYPAFSEMVNLGFGDAKVRTYILNDPAEKELYLIRKNYSMLTDNQFDLSNRLTSGAYIMLDQVVILMNKYPHIRLAVEVHTDSQGNSANNQMISQLRAQIIVNYLINRGISSKRLAAIGHGGSKPIASNFYPTERRLNRRIEFTIL